MDTPPLTPEEISRGLTTLFIGRRLLVFDTVTSTMGIARQEALQNAPEGTAIFAERQTAGRGRLKRQWLTPEGNIAVSIILYPAREHFNSLIMLASLAVRNTLQSVSGLECGIKWPNDVQIHGKKVCGILIETQAQAGRPGYAILGIGINVNMDPARHPEIQPIATSLAHETGRQFPRTEVLRRLFTELERLYLELKSGKPLYPAWRESLTTLGKAVRVHSGDDVFTGIAESVNEDGSLNLRLPDGSLMRITIGDVSLRETQSSELKATSDS